jgi:hypothetical protein
VIFWLSAGAVVVAVMLGLTVGNAGPERPLLFREGFDGPDGVITNHYAYFEPDDPKAHRSPDWEMESGCALRRADVLWTGEPTMTLPNRDCTNGTGSAVFRMWTKRDDFGDVAVTFVLRNNGYIEEGESWDGVKVYLRRQDGDNFYTAEVNRRQGNVIIQRKCEGEYALLSQVRGNSTPARIDGWEPVGGSVINRPDGSVLIEVERGGGVALEAVDPPGSCDALRRPGRIGIRGDRTDFNADELEVRALGGLCTRVALAEGKLVAPTAC